MSRSDYYGKEVTVAGKTFIIPDDAYVSNDGVVTVWFSSILGFKRIKCRRYGTQMGHVLLDGAYAQAGIKPETGRSGWYITFGLPAKWLDILNEMDKEDNNAERREVVRRDKKSRVEDGAEDENGNFIPSALDKAVLKKYNEGASIDDWRVVMIEETIEKLQPQQQDLVWSVYGEKRKRSEVAAERGVSRPAVTQAVGRVEDQCRKTCRSHGEEVPTKEEIRAYRKRMAEYQKHYEETITKALDDWDEMNGEWEDGCEYEDDEPESEQAV